MTRVETQLQNPRQDRPCRPPVALAQVVLLSFAVGVFMTLTTPNSSRADATGVLKDIGFDQNLNSQIPLNLPFRDTSGKDVLLANYFGKRPVILIMGYRDCPMMCSQVLSELTRSLKPLDAKIGKDFDIINVSINPKETPAEADSQRRIYSKLYNQPGSLAGWHGLVGDQRSINALAKAIGFRYKFNEKMGSYIHTAGFVILTPTGKISRYFFGIEYPARELKPALAAAAESRIASPIERVVMYCYEYDEKTGHYTFAIMSVIRILGIATVLALGIFLFAMVRRDRRKDRATGSPLSELPSGPAIP